MTHEIGGGVPSNAERQIDSLVDGIMPDVHEGISSLAAMGVSEQDAGKRIIANLAGRLGFHVEISAVPAAGESQDQLSAADVARLLGLSTQFVERWTVLGKIPHDETPEGTRTYRRADIDAISVQRHGADNESESGDGGDQN